MTETIALLNAVRDRSLEQKEAWPEPDWSVLHDALPESPRLPLDAFGAAADYLIRAGRGANVAPDYPAAMLLSAVGALVGKLFSVRVASDWIEPLSFWCALVGPPSSGKTPSAKPIRRKLSEIQIEIAKEHRLQVEAELQQAKEDEALPAEIAQLQKSLNEPPRHLVNDATSEALAQIEARSTRGLLVERDELSGLIEGLERYSSGVDRAYYLEGWNDGPFILDRIRSGTTMIPDHCISIAGGIQPDRFQALLTNSGDDDGFSARLLIFWPELLPAGPIPPGADHQILGSALDAISQLPRTLDDRRNLLGLEAEAYAALDNWFQTTHAARRGILGKRGSAFGKLPGYAARIAGALHVLNWAFENPREKLKDQIPETQILAALSLIENYFVPQIERAYHGTDRSPEEQVAAAVLSNAAKRKVSSLNLRTVRREWGLSGCRMKDAPAMFKRAAEILTDTGWLRAAARQGGSTDFLINPKLFSANSITSRVVV